MKIPACLHHEYSLKRLLLGLSLFLTLIVLSAFAGATLLFLLALLISNPDPLALIRSLIWIIPAVVVSMVVAAAFVRSPGWLFSRASLRFYGWALLCVISMAVLYCSIEKWRGKRIWAEMIAEMSQRGEKPGLAFLVPSPVPEDQDAAMSPIFLPLSKYDLDVDGTIIWHDAPGYARLQAIQVPTWSTFALALPDQLGWMHQNRLDMKAVNTAFFRSRVSSGNNSQRNKNAETDLRSPESSLTNYLAKFTEDLELIRVASQRPYARFKFNAMGIFSKPTHEPILCNISKVLIFRAIARLRTGEAAEALEDTRCALRLERLENQAPSSPSTYPGQTITLMSLQAVWEGLASGQWTDSQLAALQDELAQITPLAECGDSARMQCWAFMDMIHQVIPVNSAPRIDSWENRQTELIVKFFRLIYPRGWSYQDQVSVYRDYRLAMNALDAKNGRVFPERLINKQTDSLDPFYATFINPMMRLQFQHGVVVGAFAQASVNFARIACALERCRLADGRYPATLEALIPRFLPAVPADVMSGQPLGYRLTADGRFVLSSSGNKRNWGGIGHNIHPWQIPVDWIWEYPKNKTQM